VNDSPLDERLAELGERTAALGPRPGFQARVLVALGSRVSMTLRRDVVRSARLLVPMALFLAVVSVGLASRSGSVTSVDFAAAEQRWELDW
jgi:hypothetical protein